MDDGHVKCGQVFGIGPRGPVDVSIGNIPGCCLNKDQKAYWLFGAVVQGLRRWECSGVDAGVYFSHVRRLAVSAGLEEKLWK